MGPTLLALLKRGYKMACDDYCVLTLHTERLVSFPTGVTVTQQTLQFFPEFAELACESCSFYCEGEQQWTVNPGDVFETCVPYQECVISHVYLLFPDFGGASSIEECHSTAAQYWFLQNWFYPGATIRTIGEPTAQMKQRQYELARQIVEAAKFYKVVNGDVQQTADLIARTLNESGG